MRCRPLPTMERRYEPNTLQRFVCCACQTLASTVAMAVVPSVSWHIVKACAHCTVCVWGGGVTPASTGCLSMLTAAGPVGRQHTHRTCVCPVLGLLQIEIDGHGYVVTSLSIRYKVGSHRHSKGPPGSH